MMDIDTDELPSRGGGGNDEDGDQEMAMRRPTDAAVLPGDQPQEANAATPAVGVVAAAAAAAAAEAAGPKESRSGTEMEMEIETETELETHGAGAGNSNDINNTNNASSNNAAASTVANNSHHGAAPAPVEESWGTGGFDQDSVVGTMTDFPLAADPTPDGRSERWGSSGASVLDPESYEENGRTYQGYKEDRYFLPNDGEEQDRLDFQHAMIKIIMDGKLGWAPIVEGHPARALDVATGTGVWAIEFAELHPDCEVIGTDLTMIQPKPEQLPPNCTFIKEDAEEDQWTFPPRHFDYAHLRLGFSAFADTPKLLRNMYKHLRPGGWAEFQEAVVEFSSFDGSSQGTALERWSQGFVRGLASLGRDAHQAIRFKALLRVVGFVDVEERVLPCPCNHWPWERKWKRVGHYEAMNASKFVGSASAKVLISGGMTPAECHQIAENARRELNDTNLHGYWPFYVIIGRRPRDGEVQRPGTGVEEADEGVDDVDDGDVEEEEL